MTVLFSKKTIQALGLAEELDSIARPWGINLVDRILKLRQRLEAPEVQVAVVGRFKAGKSTLINAILGDEILPYDVLPCTACEVYIRHEEKPVFQIQDGEGKLRGVSREQFRDHVTTSASELARRAEIGVPHPLLKRGIRLVDTPGFDDVNQTRSEVVFGVLPESDAILMMFDGSAIGDTEIRFLKERIFNNTLTRCIFIINKVDQLSDAEIIEVREYLQGVLEKFVTQPKIVTLSAKSHLQEMAARHNVEMAEEGASTGDGQSYADEGPLDGMDSLLSVIHKEILADRDVIVAQVIDREIGSAKEWLEAQLSELKEALTRDAEALEAEVRRLEGEWKELSTAFDSEVSVSSEKLDIILSGFTKRLEDAIAKYKPKIEQRIMAADIEKLKDPNLLSAAIEAFLKEWLDTQVPILESELIALFEQHDNSIAQFVKSRQTAFGDAMAVSQTPAKIEEVVLPGLLIGGWFLLGWANFIALAFATHLGGDIIKKTVMKMLVDDDQVKQDIVDKTFARLDEIKKSLGLDIARQVRAEFDRRMAARREESLERIGERRKLYLGAFESARASSNARELKSEQIYRDLERLTHLGQSVL